MLSRVRKPYWPLIPILSVALAAGLGLAGCAHTPLALPTDDQLFAAGAVPGGASCEALQRGRALLVTQCTTCHRLFYPYEYSARAWPALIRDMGNRALLTPHQIGDVTRYVVAAARVTRCESESAASAVVTSTDRDALSRGKSLAAMNCVQCHRFYQPSERAASEWPRIVRSMAALTILPEDEIRDITAYYVESANRGR